MLQQRIGHERAEVLASKRPSLTLEIGLGVTNWLVQWCEATERGLATGASGRADNPAARFVMVENPRQRIPRARAAITSGTVDIPTASAPIRCSIRTSAGVS